MTNRWFDWSTLAIEDRFVRILFSFDNTCEMSMSIGPILFWVYNTALCQVLIPWKLCTIFAINRGSYVMITIRDQQNRFDHTPSHLVCWVVKYSASIRCRSISINSSSLLSESSRNGKKLHWTSLDSSWLNSLVDLPAISGCYENWTCTSWFRQSKFAWWTARISPSI